METGGMELWINCLKGDKEAIKKMLDYNELDVLLLEEVYEKMKPYIKGHPNLSLMSDKPCCPVCTSDSREENSIYYTGAAKYIEFRCTNCGALSKNKSAIKHKIEVRPI